LPFRQLSSQPFLCFFYSLLLGIFLVVVVVGCAGGDGEAGGGEGTAGGEHSTAGGATAREETTAAAGKVGGEATTKGDPRTTSEAKTEDGSKDASVSDQKSGGKKGEQDGKNKGEGSDSRPPDTLVAGVKDKTGGPLTEHRLVSYYGHPLSEAMGVLGQYEPQQMVKHLKEQAKVYTKLDPDLPAEPTIELIASVAQGSPGPNGLYLRRTQPETIETYAKVAEDNGCLLLLDIQIGHSTIADEIEVIRPFLERPYVHLAIDTEYDMAPGEIPGEQIGSSSAEDIKGAARTLSEMVKKKDLPPKVLVIHQFAYEMITNKEAIEPISNVEIALHADGFGTPEQKIKKYEALVTQQPIQYGGFKLFYDQDTPLLSPKQVLEALEPNPAVVSYQ
jgi:hypothetical protein